MNKSCKVYYLLSEEGRKKSLLSGGNGKMVQEFFTELTPELLKKGNVNENGEVNIVFGVKSYFNLYDSQITRSELSDYWDGVTTDYKMVKPEIIKTYERFEYKASDGKKYKTQYNDEHLISHEIKEGRIEEKRRLVMFDKPMTIEELLEWDNERIKNLKVKEEELKKEIDNITNELMKEIEIRNTEIEEENEKRKKAFIEKVEAKINYEKEKKKLEKEKAEWIKKYGSERLQKAFKYGYECQRMYVIERAEQEFPDYIVDFNETAEFYERVNPSLEALEEVEALIEKGYNAEIVWLTAEPTNNVDDEEDYEDYDDYFEEREAIRIRNYLGRYDLYKIVG